MLNGFWFQFGYNNALTPQAREALTVQSGETTEMIVGRVLGNSTSAVQAALEIEAATTIGAGEAAACGTVVLCLAGAPAMAVGVGVAGHAAFVGINALEEGGKLGNILMAKSGRSSSGINWSIDQAKKERQMTARGWNEKGINSVLDNPADTQKTVNRANGNSATAYYRSDGYYIVQDDVTGEIFQFSDTTDPNWFDDIKGATVSPVNPD